MNNLINRLSATMTEADFSGVKELIDQIETRMPFLTGLTADERVTLPKISDSNKAFVQNCINAMDNNVELLPSYLKLEEIKKDLQLFEQLEVLELLSLQLTEKIRDSKMLCGSEAYVSSLSAYRFFEAAAMAGVPGADTAYDSLKKRFASQGNKAGNSTAAATDTATLPMN